MSIPGSASPLLLASTAAAAAGYQVSRSLRFNSADSAYLSRTPAVAGNRRTWTWAGWVKRSKLGAEQSLFTCYTPSDVYTILRFLPGDALSANQDNGGGNVWSLTTAMLFRDPSAWYHIVIAFDTTIASPSSDRIKLYVNGSRVTDFSSASYPSQNLDTNINRANEHLIGQVASTSFYSGYLAETYFIDGQQLTPSSFTEVSATTGQLIPLAYAGTYGTNGFKLKFSDNSAATAATLGADTSGNGNNWTPNNLSVTAGAGNDSLVDTPTSYGTPDTGVGNEVRGNYCTWNPLSKASSTTLSNGNLDMSEGSGVWQANIATIGVKSGKWYWEQTMTTNTYSYTGICNQKFLGNINTSFPGQTVNSWSYLTSSGIAKNDQGGGSEISVTLTTMASGGGTLGFALDLDNQKLWFSLNGTWMGSGSPNPATGVSAAFTNLTAVDTYFPCASNYASSSTFNFGQRAFAYTAPSGFKALCDTNLGAPVVAKPNTVMDVVTYTGTGAALTPTSSLGFNPDWIWIKSRSAATDHALYDVVRGAQARLESNTTDAEVTTDGGVTAFNSAGFTLGTLAQVNTSAATYAAWCWDAGTSTVSNTAGSITSQVRANVSAGFSVVTYTGNGGTNGSASWGHGLGVQPNLVIIKNRSVTGNWVTEHKDIPYGRILLLNSTLSVSDSYPTEFQYHLSTSSLYYVGSTSGGSNTNSNSQNYVAYCFAPVVGYSSMGSYTGNGSADGPFVYTGFRPRFLLFKSTTTAYWGIYDAARNTYNAATSVLYPNDSSNELTDQPFDFLSNGFKIRGTGSFVNTSSQSYIYYAVAESPFNYSRAR